MYEWDAMPRRRKGDGSPDKVLSGPGRQLSSGNSNTQSQYGRVNSNGGGPGLTTGGGPGFPMDPTHSPLTPGREEVFHAVQEMFKGKIEGDVVYMVLSECDWKGKTDLSSLT